MKPKSLIYFAAVMACVSVALCIVPPSSKGQNTNYVFSKIDWFGSVIWGAETNGYCGGVSLGWSYDHFEFKALILRTTEFSKSVRLNTNNNTLFAPPYLIATNWFCGPIELRDPHGKKVPLQKQEVNLSDAYPDSLSWNSLFFDAMSKNQKRIPGKAAVFGLNYQAPEAKIGFYKLNDYFQLQEAGEYKLTIWPKLYRQSETNLDVYWRMDLPPVTVSILWSGN